MIGGDYKAVLYTPLPLQAPTPCLAFLFQYIFSRHEIISITFPYAVRKKWASDLL